MKKEIAALLRRARKQRKESQAALAERLGVSQQLVSRLERGEGSLKQIALLCRGLGLALRLQVGDETFTLVHPLHPDERRAIEENLEWFSGIDPLQRLKTTAIHAAAAAVLKGKALEG